MKIKKVKGTYNDYSLEMSFGQLLAIKNALGADHADPVADELYAELDWYLTNIPGPGEDEEDIKKAEEAEDSGLASPDAALPEPPGAEEEEEEEKLLPPEEPEPESEADRRLPPPPPAE